MKSNNRIIKRVIMTKDIKLETGKENDILSESERE